MRVPARGQRRLAAVDTVEGEGPRPRCRRRAAGRSGAEGHHAPAGIRASRRPIGSRDARCLEICSASLPTSPISTEDNSRRHRGVTAVRRAREALVVAAELPGFIPEVYDQRAELVPYARCGIEGPQATRRPARPCAVQSRRLTIHLREGTWRSRHLPQPGLSEAVACSCHVAGHAIERPECGRACRRHGRGLAALGRGGSRTMCWRIADERHSAVSGTGRWRRPGLDWRAACRTTRWRWLRARRGGRLGERVAARRARRRRRQRRPRSPRGLPGARTG
jgi:hypothetical protein